MAINDADLLWASSRWADLETALSKLGPDRKTEKGRVFEEITRLYLLSGWARLALKEKAPAPTKAGA